MASSRSLRELALAYIASFEHMVGDGNIALRTPEFTSTILPTSLGHKSNMTNSERATRFSALQKIITAFPVTPIEVLESGSQVTIWARGCAHFRTDLQRSESVSDWPTVFENENIFVLQFDEAGQKIEKILEMVDSASLERVEPFVAEMRSAAAKLSTQHIGKQHRKGKCCLPPILTA